jgi:hypothetical protein
VGLGRYSGGETVDDSLARAIQAKRGTAQGLDSGVRRKMEMFWMDLPLNRPDQLP